MGCVLGRKPRGGRRGGWGLGCEVIWTYCCVVLRVFQQGPARSHPYLRGASLDAQCGWLEGKLGKLREGARLGAS